MQTPKEIPCWPILVDVEIPLWDAVNGIVAEIDDGVEERECCCPRRVLLARSMVEEVLEFFW